LGVKRIKNSLSGKILANSVKTLKKCKFKTNYREL